MSRPRNAQRKSSLTCIREIYCVFASMAVILSGCSADQLWTIKQVSTEEMNVDRNPVLSQTNGGKPRTEDPAFWDQMAADYEAKAHPFSRLYAEAMLEKLDVRSGMRLLDVAAGTGAASIPAAEMGADVVAIDFSSEMIRLLQARDIANIDARQMDGQALTLPDASFHITVSVFGVMVFPDWNQGLREMARVTRPGGVGAVVTWRDPKGAGINQIVGEICSELLPDVPLPPPPEGMVVLSDPDQLARSMVAAGFEAPEVEIITQRFAFSIDEVFSANPWSQLLTEEQQRQVLEEIELRYGDSQEGDYLFVNTDAVFVRATRSEE